MREGSNSPARSGPHSTSGMSRQQVSITGSIRVRVAALGPWEDESGPREIQLLVLIGPVKCRHGPAISSSRADHMQSRPSC